MANLNNESPSLEVEAAYWIDVLEHLDAATESTVIENIIGCLPDDGVLLTGTPNKAAHQYGSPQSQALHINQKLGASTPPPICTTVPVKFRVANANTVFGQNVHVTGNRAELGNWTATTGNMLTIEGSGANVPWSRTFQLPPGTPIQYKFIKYGAGSTVWERNQSTSSGNREAVTPACGQPTLTLDAGSFAF